MNLEVVEMKNLRQMIESELLPGLEETGLRIIGESGSRWGMGQSVDLRAGNLKIQVLRDKQDYEVLFGSAVDPFEWFGWSTVSQYLGKEPPSFSTTDADALVGELRHFLSTDMSSTVHIFSPENYSQAKPSLVHLRTSRARAVLLSLREQRPDV